MSGTQGSTGESRFLGREMPEAGNSRLGRDLKKLREERKLTLGGVESLSVGFGERIAKTYLFRVERGKTYPTLSRLRILSRIYRVRLSRLVESLENAVEEQELSADLGVDIKQATFEELRKHGIAAERGGEFSKATLLYRAAWQRAQQEEGTPEERAIRIAKARVDLAIALRNAGHLELAREEAEAALELAPRPSNLLDSARLTLATIYRRAGQVALAREVLEGLLSRSGELTQKTLVGAHETMGNTLVACDPRKAALHYRAALVIVKKSRDDFDHCSLINNIAVAEARAKNFDRALRLLHEGYELAKRRHFNSILAIIASEIAKTLYLKGDRDGARGSLREANDIARRGDYHGLLFINHYYMRRLAIDEGNAAEARIAESSLKFFATKLEEPCDELKAYLEERR